MRYLVLYIALLMSSLVSAQNSEIIDDALKAYKSGDLIKAKTLINEALEIPSNAENPKIWNFKGHIYKQLYKTEGLEEGADARDISVEAFIQSCNLSNTSKYYSDNKKALDYLSATYYNDAVKGAAVVKYNGDEDPVVYFQKFKTLSDWLNPDQDITREELGFLKMLAQGFGKIHLENQDGEEVYMDKAISYYEQALELSPNDYEANFNLAIVYYNEGASLISQINYKTGFIELMEIQKKCVGLFEQALPFMEKAESMRPNRVETLKGLMFINRALNNFDKYLEYKVQLEEILKK